METITTTVAPDPLLCGQSIKLGPIDQIAPRDYSATLTFFRLRPGADHHHIFENLQHGVYEAAREIPQALSCIAKSKNDREELELVWDAGVGASVTFKDYTASRLRDEWTSGSFDDLEREHFPLERLPRRLVLGINKESRTDLLAGTVIQANFIPGGLILSICVHHTLCDVFGIFDIHKAIAKHMAAVGGGREVPRAPRVFIQDRNSVVPPAARVCLDDLPDWKPAASGDDFLDPTTHDPQLSPEMKYSTFFISESKLRQLREELNNDNGVRFSAIEAVGALIWKSVLQAREVDCNKYPEAKLSITVDARGRMTDVPVQTNYWGNFCEPNAVARMSTKALCQPSSSASLTGRAWDQTFVDAAQRIKRAINAVDNTAVRRLVGLLNQMPKATSLTWNVDRWPGPDMLIVCLNKQLYNELDFGPDLGRSEAFRFTVGNTEAKPDGRCLIMPPRKGCKGLEIMLQYDLDTLARLRHNEAFAEFLEWRN